MSASNTAHVPMDEPHLSRYGANAARALELEGAVRPGTVAREMRRALAEVERARQEELARWAEESGRTPGAVEWLLDNAYLAAREGRMAERAFRRGRPLRRCRNGQSVLQCAARTALWAVPDLDRRRLTVFLSAFQSVLPLTERELSLLVPALTWALLCQLRGLCGDLAALREEQTGPAPLSPSLPGCGPCPMGTGGAAGVGEPGGGCPAPGPGGVLWLHGGRHTPEIPGTGVPSGEKERHGGGRRRPGGSWSCPGRGGGGAPRGLVPLPPPAGGGEKDTVRGVLRPAGPALCRPALRRSGSAAGQLGGGLLLFSPVRSGEKQRGLSSGPSGAPAPGPPHGAGVRHPAGGGRTLCVIAALLTGKESGRELAEKLERYHLANRDSGGELRLGMLADLPDRDAPHGGGGAELGPGGPEGGGPPEPEVRGRLLPLFREPRYSARDGRWMGWERKRGALVELVRLLKDRPSGLEVLSGDGGPWRTPAMSSLWTAIPA